MDALPVGVTIADAQGRVWYLRTDHEIGLFDGHQTNIVTEPSLNGQRVRVLTADPRGNIWVGTDKGLYEWETNHFETMTPTNGEATISVRKIVPSGYRMGPTRSLIMTRNKNFRPPTTDRRTAALARLRANPAGRTRLRGSYICRLGESSRSHPAHARLPCFGSPPK